MALTTRSWLPRSEHVAWNCASPHGICSRGMRAHRGMRNLLNLQHWHRWNGTWSSVIWGKKSEVSLKSSDEEYKSYISCLISWLVAHFLNPEVRIFKYLKGTPVFSRREEIKPCDDDK